jgi:hypothetical protein
MEISMEIHQKTKNSHNMTLLFYAWTYIQGSVNQQTRMILVYRVYHSIVHITQVVESICTYPQWSITQP